MCADLRRAMVLSHLARELLLVPVTSYDDDTSFAFPVSALLKDFVPLSELPGEICSAEVG